MPHVDAIFEGLDDLGSSPEMVASMVERQTRGRPGRNPRVLDLACGKGGVGVRLAEKFGCRVVGVDACEGFIASAKALARERGVGRACSFRVGEVMAFRDPRPFDLAMMLGLFGVERAAVLLRRHVGVGGLYLFDDAVRLGRASGLANVPTLAAARRALQELGDTIVDERVLPHRETRRQSLAIARRCQRLARDKPEMARSLRAFVERLEASQELLRTRLRGMVWCVKKG